MGAAGSSGSYSPDDDVIELVDQSATTALEHASALNDHLRAVQDDADLTLRECQAEMHRLVGDIVSLRNAAELLKRRSLGTLSDGNDAQSL